MGTGDDIKGALQDVGTSYTLIRDAGHISGEYLDFELNTQVTKPFIREFFLEAVLPYDTEVIAGEVIRFNDDGRAFLVMNRTPAKFEDETISYESVLFKCNVSGELKRFSGETWDAQTYRHKSAWELIRSDCYGLLTEKLFGTDLIQDEEAGQLGVEAQVVYIPHVIGVQALDRYEAVSGEYYKITFVEERKFDAVDVCHVEEDTRE